MKKNKFSELKKNRKQKLKAIFLALVVTFLWSTSFIIIKNGLGEIPPITFAGFRYFLAFIILIPAACRRNKIKELGKLSRKNWMLLILLGLVFYTITQGIQFIGLSMISTVTVSLMLNFTPLVVVILGMVFLREKPNILQGAGVLIFIIGILLYFKPFDILNEEKTGIFIMMLGVLANAFSSVLGRKINMKQEIDPVNVTLISMGAGATILLAAGLTIEGFYMLSLKNLISLVWLAFINTAFAFTLWNLSLRTLTAMESSIINGTMLIQIAILSIIFLDLHLSTQKLLSLFIIAAGAILVQIKKKRPKDQGCTTKSTE